ncbi:MAG: monooxygenase FAD-binding [Devosia sp.]|uniref:NAD(P)/FAD-dependent oxidoreductase n=1 Tax=Devosia sp. TaxID=1871048 RepID=UPI002626AEEA|nr:FAD-dependent monooxygenase [Devosia sp.]MDB5529408.1 monooxygenase FAD-binding [Devosia sp.]
MDTHFDAVIIGAGPAGTAAAIGLAQQGRSVAIVERSEFPRRKVCGEFTSATNVDLLDRLGVGAEFRRQAGPEVRRVALFAAGEPVEAPMPQGRGTAFGRALGRDVLDGLLLDAASDAGVTVFQPCRAVDIVRGHAAATVAIETAGAVRQLHAPVVIAAHGSWEPGKLSSNFARINRPRDFLGFKAHFLKAKLPGDLMPLIAFPGGYGGMVWSDRDRLSLSFCIRRDALAAARQASPGSSAAEATFIHILKFCPGVDEALRGAELAEGWLAAGPIRPGIRPAYADDIFRVGNVAGESHPIIAEGIAMALQSGWILAAQLGKFDHWDSNARAAAGRAYSRAWRNQFATRIRLAAGLSRLATSSHGASLMHRFISQFPTSLALGARLSGKTKSVPEFTA